MTTSERAPLSRNTLRAAVIVFCTVFIGGLGIGGAAALWSQATTVATTVTTGHWIDYTRPGWKAPLTVSVVETRYDAFLARQTVEVSWAPQNAADLPTAGVTYTIDVVKRDGTGWVHDKSAATTTGSGGRATVVLARTWGLRSSYTATITPHVNGVAGSPTSGILIAKAWGNGVEWVN